MSSFADWTTKAQKVYPSAANGTSITPNATPFANSNWAQITAGINHSIIITGFCVLTNEVGLWRFDLGTGTAGNEVVVGTWGEHVETILGMSEWDIIPPIIITANTAISARVRKSGTSVTATAIKIQYYDLDDAPPKARSTFFQHQTRMLWRGGGTTIGPRFPQQGSTRTSAAQLSRLMMPAQLRWRGGGLTTTAPMVPQVRGGAFATRQQALGIHPAVFNRTMTGDDVSVTPHPVEGGHPLFLFGL